MIIIFISLLFTTSAIALINLTIFGPKQYDRLKGKPTIYTDTFKSCSAASEATLKITNGGSKQTRIKSARIYVNGVKVASENDFKSKIPSFEKTILVKDMNDLKVVLKSGRHGYFGVLATSL